ncbi:polysaccharide lyase [Streptomyces sp. NPDC057694]|uniref:polysaccharide lyase n=1 Tax=Streptomyces sp. NPDC057694 TaxID=3346216 RepID=UPI0036740D73
MRRRQFMLAGAAAAGTVLVGCSSGSKDDDHSTPSPGTPSPGTPSGPLPTVGADTVAGLFGAQVSARHAGSFGLDRAALLLGGGPVPGPVLRVRYPARSASPTVARTYDRPEGGAQLYLPLRSGPVDRLHLRYCLRFPSGFDFVKGGKLPGLYGGTDTSGGRIPDGTDGLSTRYMWRSGGRGEVYAYLPTSKVHGTSLGRGSWSWPVGRWTCVEQSVVLNRPGRRDGSVTVDLDGRRVFDRDGLEFRTTDDLRIAGVFFSTFFGGGDPSWATPRTQYADFTAFTVAHHPIGPPPGLT